MSDDVRIASVLGLVVAGLAFVFTGIQIFAFAVLAFGCGIIADGMIREKQD